MQEIYKFVVQIYNSDGRYFNLQSGSKKLFVYHGTLSWVEDSSDDVRSLNVIHDGPEYFCTEPAVTFYILTVSLGKLKGNGERFVILTFAVSVLPYLIISFLALLVGFRTTGKPLKTSQGVNILSSVCRIIVDRPLLLLSGLISNLSVSSCGRSHVCLSVPFSCINLLITNITLLPIIGLIITASLPMFYIHVAVLGTSLLLSSLVFLVSLCRFSRVSTNVKTVFKVGDLQTEEKFSLLL